MKQEIDEIRSHDVLTTSDRLVPSQNSQSERQITRPSILKARSLRLDSPTTIQACRELGIVVESLVQKTLDDFRGPSIDEEISQLRFQHYLKKYNQAKKDVFLRRRQLVRARHKSQQIQRMKRGSLGGVEDSPDRGKDFVIASPHSIFHQTSPFLMLKQSGSLSSVQLPNQMANSYNKALSYFRNSHQSVETKDLQDLLGDDADTIQLDETVDKFDSALAREISKFNKVRSQKQKEAKDAFEEEMKRVEIAEKMKEKEKRRIEHEKKVILERKRLEEDRKIKAEEKLEKIREIDVQYQALKEQAKEKMNLKLDTIRKKIAEDLEQKRRAITEREERLEEKRRLTEERRISLKQDEEFRRDRLRIRIQSKLYNSQEKHHSVLSERASRAHNEIVKIEEGSKRTRIKQEQDANEYIQRVVSKLVRKEQNFKIFQEKHMQEIKKKEKEAEKKSARLYDNQAGITQEHREKIAEVNERFEKVQENLHAKKEQEEKELRIKQELNRLRMLDKQENYQRKQRQLDYQQQIALEKDRYHKEKILWIKSQKEMMKQAQTEATIQAKIEKERIEHAIQNLSKLTNETIQTSSINDKQKKILRTILKPEDYKTIEDKELKKRQAKLEIAAKQKVEKRPL